MLDSSHKQKARIGEILLEYGLITHDQLTGALEKQMQSKRRLGSILEEMGFVDVDTLLTILSKQYNRPHVNLYEVKLSPDILNILPFEQVKYHKILPLNKTDDSVSLAMVDPEDTSAIRNVEYTTGGQVKPFIVPHFQMDRAIHSFEQEGYGSVPFEGDKLIEDRVRARSGLPGIYALFRLVPDFGATDLHLAAGAPPSMRIGSELKRLSMPNITPAQMKDFVSEILRQGQMEEFERAGELDFVLPLTDTGRFRVNIYRQRNSISLSARLILENVPSLNDLHLPEWLADYALKPQGLLLIAGSAGQGKTTTMSALVNVINSTRHANIITLEDPIQYLQKHNRSNVNQREVGIDSESFAQGLRHIMRQDPDVIAIGDLRDPESISIALNAAETGHLVIGVIHSQSAAGAIEKILNIFPEQQRPQIKLQLADTLLMVYAQKLVPLREGEGKIPAFEKIINSPRVSNLIREGKVSNIRSLMQIAADDVTSVDHSIARLCIEGRVSFEEGLAFADNPAYFQELIKTGRV